jgi:AcrR family transcriptional regulator
LPLNPDERLSRTGCGQRGYRDREELIKRGLEALERTDADAISLRALASDIGVSKAAPYRHFPSKEVFLGALAEEGFRMLCGALEAARPGTTTALGALGPMGRAYMQFAADHPELYRLMFSPIVETIPDDQIHWARRALGLLAESIVTSRSGQDTGLTPGSQSHTDAIAATWGFLHGLALLRLDDLFPDRIGFPEWDRLAGTAERIAIGSGPWAEPW